MSRRSGSCYFSITIVSSSYALILLQEKGNKRRNYIFLFACTQACIEYGLLQEQQTFIRTAITKEVFQHIKQYSYTHLIIITRCGFLLSLSQDIKLEYTDIKRNDD